MISYHFILPATAATFAAMNETLGLYLGMREHLLYRVHKLQLFATSTIHPTVATQHLLTYTRE